MYSNTVIIWLVKNEEKQDSLITVLEITRGLYFPCKYKHKLSTHLPTTIVFQLSKNHIKLYPQRRKVRKKETKIDEFHVFHNIFTKYKDAVMDE